MIRAYRSLTTMVFTGLLAAAPALAADAPVATATANADQPSIAAQIDDYLRTSPAVALPKDPARGITPGDEDTPRQVHGVVDVAVGSHGYRSAYVRSDFPLGKTGTLSVAVQETRGRGFYGYDSPYGYGGYSGYGNQPYRNQNVAIGLAFGGAAQDADGRCREAAGGPRRHRIDPGMLGDDPTSACDRATLRPQRPLY